MLTADWNDRGRNAKSYPNTITANADIARRHKDSQHQRGAFISFADGHAAWLKDAINEARSTRNTADNDAGAIYLAPLVYMLPNYPGEIAITRMKCRLEACAPRPSSFQNLGIMRWRWLMRFADCGY